MGDERIIGKIVLRGRIECESPFHVGNGASEKSDMDVLRDENGAPFIPATAFIGALRHWIRPDLETFWGFTRKDAGKQSAVRCSDLMSRSGAPKVLIRHGIRMDNAAGLVKDQGKYDYEIVERGARFNLKMEFSYTESDQTLVGDMAASIISALHKGEIQIGAKTNGGLGVITLKEEATRVYKFDFTKKKNVFRWLTRAFSRDNLIPADELGAPFQRKRRRFRLDLTLKLKNALIIRSYSEEPGMPDAVHLKSLDDWVLTGSSLKGAIRARAERIVNTLGKPGAIITDLFGNVEDETRSKNAKKGRVRVWEVVLPEFMAALQTRNRIDRFTGGTIEAALFDSMPLFAVGSDKVLSLRLEIRGCKDHEAGLLLLVLKDLWTGDLAVGGEKGVGRGVFQGVGALIEYDGMQTSVERSFERLDPGEKERLQSFVSALNSENPS